MQLTRRTVLLSSMAATIPDRAMAAGVSLPKPQGKVIFTVSGKIGAFNAGDTAEFDRAMLESFGYSSFTTWTPWYNDPVTFSGLPMAKLMHVLRATGTSVLAIALNDYETRIPVSDFAQFNVLLAIKRNGQYMPVSDKGPLFIVYPFDSNPQLQQDKFYMRSVWQVSGLDVR